MKLLTESLPQNDLQKICLLIARTIPVAAVKLFVFPDMEIVHKSSGQLFSNDKKPKIQVVTTVVLPENKDIERECDMDTKQLEDIWHNGECQVIHDPFNSGEPATSGRKVTVQPLQLILPKGVWVDDKYEGWSLNSQDSHDLPALKTTILPAVLCLVDFPENSRKSSSESRLTAYPIESLKTFSELLEESVKSWTLIQHEQHKLRKLKHDLRTPLTSLTMLPDLIKAVPNIDQESAEMCELLKVAAHKLDLILTAPQSN